MADILDDVVRALQDGGVDAVRRDWVLGRSVVVPGGARSDHKGMVVWERVVWALDDNGQQIAARFALVLCDASDLARFAPEQVRVLLPGGTRSAVGLANPE
jgi:hypothetical protein